MKSFLISLALLISFFSVQATHVRGGEITWECLKQGTDMGKFVFKVKLWKNCYQGAAGLPTTISLTNPLYSTYGGVSTITCVRLSITDISPMCYDSSSQIQCGLGGSLGNMSLEEHYYVSSNVQINGIPPVTGAAFSYTTCCRVTSVNSTGSGMYLRSIMYPYVDPATNTVQSLGSSTAGPTCFDSSPIFTEKLPYIQIDGKQNFFSLNALDIECDSLNYQRSLPMINDTTGISFKNGFSLLYPFGQSTISVPLAINPKTGWASHQSYYSTNGALFNMSHMVTAYKDQQKVAEIFRDYVAIMTTGASDSFALMNNPPYVTFKNASASTYSSMYSDTFYVGDSVHINIKAEDNDLLAANTNQTISMRIVPNRALTSLFNPSGYGCVFSTCASMDTSNVLWTGSDFKGIQSVFADFKWKMECEHLIQCGNLVDRHDPQYETYTFQIEALDNSCFMPGRYIGEFSITLHDTSKPEAPLNRIVFQDTMAHVSWRKHVGPGFLGYKVYKSATAGGTYVLLDSIANINDTTYIDSLGLSTNSHAFYKVVSDGAFTCLQDRNTASSLVLHVYDTSTYLSQLKWNDLDYITGLNNNNYYVVEADTGNGWFFLDSITSGSTIYDDVSNLCKPWVNYRILGFDSTKNISFVSNVDSARYVFPTYNDSLQICAGDSVKIGGIYRTTPGIYQKNLQTYQGCDSIVFVELAVDSVLRSTTNHTICNGDSIFIHGHFYSSPTTLSFTYPGAVCDSVATHKIAVTMVDTSVTFDGLNLNANATNASYDWVSCQTNKAVGNTNKGFTPSANGVYAVVVTQNGCSDTSSCFNVQTVGIQRVASSQDVLAYPNPANEEIIFELKDKSGVDKGILILVNAQGKVVMTQDYELPYKLNISDLPDGMYFYQLTNDKSQSHSGRVVVKH